ncbi:hypothetical protein KQI69_06315 [Eubacterium sp. MSJ-13]|uniref:hypothetical protein n=1 Tax=Eubacterium sp. MSJ-13 TaxID=2841513 RepID=UPI001C1127C0|nr:hypothetical protein [Eubacterium sp. MSJ-13]MBU5478816.1 hypothetical protein [Eubacterium sp. MSJ-13]
MKGIKIYEEMDYLSDFSGFGEETLSTVQKAVSKNNAVGAIVGRYDEKLTILSVSRYMLDNLGYDYDEFMSFTKGSLRKKRTAANCCNDSQCFCGRCADGEEHRNEFAYSKAFGF